MLELLVRLEYKRQALRKRVLGCLADLDRSFLGLAALVLFAFLPTIVAPALAATEAAPEGVVVGALILIGTILCATIIAAPVGIVFF